MKILQLMLLAAITVVFGSGCATPQRESTSPCAVWYGKPDASVIGDDLEVGTWVAVHQVSNRLETIGQVIVWEKLVGDKLVGGKKTTTASGFYFRGLKEGDKGYFLIHNVPGIGISFFKDNT